jgi:hypothetical protein
MTDRVSKTPVVFSRRAVDNKVVELVQEGPFINVRLNGIDVGGVRKGRKLLSQDGCSAELCLVLKDYVIELTDEEEAIVQGFVILGHKPTPLPE